MRPNYLAKTAVTWIRPHRAQLTLPPTRSYGRVAALDVEVGLCAMPVGAPPHQLQHIQRMPGARLQVSIGLKTTQPSITGSDLHAR